MQVHLPLSQDQGVTFQRAGSLDTLYVDTPNAAMPRARSPIPTPPLRIWLLLDRLALLLGGGAEILRCSETRHPAGLIFPDRKLAALGTACDRPLLRGEAEDVTRISDCAVLILRHDRTQSSWQQISFDLTFDREWWCQYRLWQRPASSELWLVAGNGAGPAISLAGAEFQQSWLPPFQDQAERRAGFAQAAASLQPCVGH